MSDASEKPERAGSSSEIILYQTEDRRTQIDVRLEGETVWLNQRQMAETFETSVPNIHIRNVFDEGELREDATESDIRLSITTSMSAPALCMPWTRSAGGAAKIVGTPLRVGAK